MIIKAKFKKEKTCKHSIRFKPVDEVGEGMSSAIYIKNDALTELKNPEEIIVQIESKK